VRRWFEDPLKSKSTSAYQETVADVRKSFSAALREMGDPAVEGTGVVIV